MARLKPSRLQVADVMQKTKQFLKFRKKIKNAKCKASEILLHGMYEA